LVVFLIDPTPTQKNDKRNKNEDSARNLKLFTQAIFKVMIFFGLTFIREYCKNLKNLECMQYLQVGILYIPWIGTFCLNYLKDITQKIQIFKIYAIPSCEYFICALG
jgi:hypothetical protein